MIDNYGRTIDYIRISVTDRCNLRCRYCMPEEGACLLSHDEILRFEEIERICRLGAELGIRKVKLTGGEPLARKNVVSLVESLGRMKGIDDITMTSNGCLLDQYARELKRAGLSCVNISLDTLDPRRFAEITRRDVFDQVMNGIHAARTAGLEVKINCAVMEDLTGEEVLEFADFSIREGIPVRFIEMMPIGQGRRFEALDNETLRGLIGGAYPDMEPARRARGNGPAVYWQFADGKGCVGFISAVHHKFCGDCNRVRLTSDGFLKLCLASDDGLHLQPLLRGGMGDEELMRIIREQIERKPVSHHFEEIQDGFCDHTERNMNQIGG